MILMIYDPIPLILYTLPKCLISLRAHGFWGVFNIRGKGFFIAVIGMFQKKNTNLVGGFNPSEEY